MKECLSCWKGAPNVWKKRMIIIGATQKFSKSGWDYVQVSWSKSNGRSKDKGVVHPKLPETLSNPDNRSWVSRGAKNSTQWPKDSAASSGHLDNITQALWRHIYLRFFLHIGVLDHNRLPLGRNWFPLWNSRKATWIRKWRQILHLHEDRK